MAAERPDLLEICDKYTLNYFGGLTRAGLARALPHAPLVVGLSCERMDDNFSAYVGSLPFARRFCAAYVKWLYFPLFDHHIANSDYTAEELQIASRGDTLGRKICIRPMGVDLGHFSPSRKSLQARRILGQACGGSADSVLLVYAGRLVPEKNLPLLFDVLAALVQSGRRDYRLLVAGDGIERERWERYCAERAPGRVFFAGHVKEVEQLAGLLANADAFVHPNHREPFGIAPLEAMASGLPLIAPDRGGVASYANEENAWIAAPSCESFRSAIEARLADQPEADRRARKALETASRFRWESAAGAFLDLYAELYRGPRLRPAPWFA